MPGLQAAELVIAQDAFLDTETNRYADVLLPGALWAEAEGVMINSERNMTLMQKAIEPPGAALPDWQIIARVACEMGFADAFSYASAEEVFEEITRASNPKTGYDLRGASHRAAAGNAAAMAAVRRHARATAIRIRYLNDGVSQTLKEHARRQPSAAGVSDRTAARPCSSRGRISHRPKCPVAGVSDRAEHRPLAASMAHDDQDRQGRDAQQAQPGPVRRDSSRKTPPRSASRPRIRSRSVRAAAAPCCRRSSRTACAPGNCFAPMHWNDVFGEDLCINAVTNDAIDPISQQPEFKFCAVALSPRGSCDCSAGDDGDRR